MSDLPQDFWKRKLAAFLHDPPSKALDIARHWEVARSAYAAAGFSEDEINRYEKSADHTAAAADRLPFPNALASGMRCHFDGERNAFLHPMSGDPLRFRPLSSADLGIEGHQTVQPVIADFGDLPEDERWRAKFFAHWRRWREAAVEKDWRLGFLPADTRIPDHSIWHHMGVVSALAGCSDGGGNLRPAFLKVQIGPVQDFIAAAGSVRDLWSGSYLLSWLMAAGLKALSAQVGPDAVIFPSLYGQPLFDLHWRDDLWDRIKVGERTLWQHWDYKHDKQLLVPNLPNVFLALVPESCAGQLGERVAGAIDAEWKRIARKSWAFCEAQGLTGDEGAIREAERAARFERQIGRFLQIAWQADPWPQSLQAARDLAKPGIPVVAKAAELVNRVVQMAEQQMPQDHRDRRYYTSDEKNKLRNVGAAWSILVQHIAWELDAVRATRAFAPASSSGWEVGADCNKDAFTGREEAVAGGEEWVARCEKAGGHWHSLFKKPLWLGAATLVKRVWHLAYLRDKEGWNLRTGHGYEFPMPNTRGIAAGRPFDDSDQDPADVPADEKYFAVLALDGDEMGKWVSGEKMPALRRLLASYTDAGANVPQGAAPYFEAATFKSFLETSRPLSPGFHLQFSETLCNFSLRVAAHVVEHFSGRLIYAGGDDVLAMLPAFTAMDCAAALARAFAGKDPEVPGLAMHAPGFLTRADHRQRTGHAIASEEQAIPFPVPAADCSVGVAMAHFKAPLQDVVRAAQAAEKRAKRAAERGGLGRAAVAVTLMKRSGEISEWGCKWTSGGVEAHAAILQAMHNEVLSAKFPHRVIELLTPYLADDSDKLGATASAAGFGEAVDEIIAREVGIAAERQKGRKPDADAAGNVLAAVCAYAGKLGADRKAPTDAQAKIRGVIGLMTSVAFARRISDSENEPKGTA